MTSRRAAVSAIDLIHGTGFLNQWSHKSGSISPPFSLFSSKAFQPKQPRIDFSCVKELNDAIGLFQKMKSMQPEPSVLMYNNLLSVTAKIEEYSFALYMFDEMLRMGVPVNVYTMNIAVNCCCLLKDIKSGFAYWLFFKRVEPNVRLHTLIKGLFLNHKVAEAGKLFNMLLRFRICEPNDVMIVAMVDGLCKSGNVLPARDFVRRLERSRSRLDVKAYSALLDGLRKSGMVDDALQLLSAMIEKGITPNVVTYNSMIQGLWTRETGGCKVLVNEMSNSNISLNVITFSILIDAYCKERKMEEAEDLLEIMKQRNVCPTVVTYNTLIDGYCLRGKLTKHKVLDSMVDKGLKPNIVTYNCLLNGYCRKGRIDEAWLHFLEVPCKGLEHDTITYTTMIHGLFSKRRFSEGWKLFKDMEARRVCPDIYTYSTLLDGLCMNGETDEALSFLHMIEGKGVTPDRVTYGVVINGLCKNGKLDVARDLFNQLPSRGVLPNARMYNNIIGALCHEGSTEEAQCLLTEMQSRGCAPTSVTYNIMTRSFLKKKELSKAIPYLEVMREKGLSADVSTLSMLIDQMQGKTKDRCSFSN
uniref:Pentatricopeptide repeat protein n=1 Tax=Salvia miltiorrhiza TaxID=226208 RepID=A0A678WEE0_SALMI|nr:pentatricopeptide repeat protein [Salvia miltiorrhiza]